MVRSVIFVEKSSPIFLFLQRQKEICPQFTISFHQIDLSMGLMGFVEFWIQTKVSVVVWIASDGKGGS